MVHALLGASLAATCGGVDSKRGTRGRLLLALAGILGFLQMACGRGPFGVEHDMEPDVRLGKVLGAAVARDVPGGGGVLVLDYPPRPELVRYVDARAGGLVETLGEDFPLRRATVEEVARAYGLEEPGRPLMEGGLTPETYADLLDAYPEVVAVVSFIPEPPERVSGVVRDGQPPLYMPDPADPGAPAAIRIVAGGGTGSRAGRRGVGLAVYPAQTRAEGI